MKNERREFIKTASLLSMAPLIASANNVMPTERATFDLSAVRRDMTEFGELLLDKNGRYGSYRRKLGERTDLYSSLDFAIMRHIMGEDLKSSLAASQREAWIAHINSFVSRDGSYFDRLGHSVLHANGMVVGALSVLGGKQKYPVTLYDSFNTEDKVIPWLESLNWSRQWQGSHNFWGGVICFSMSSQCSPKWLDTVFNWLDAHIDERTGWWKKGVEHADRHQPLGGSVHILPLYEHHKRPFPFPERVIDSVIDLQLTNGRWLETTSVNIMHYLELDALYALQFMRKLAPGYRAKDIQAAVDRYSKAVLIYYKQRKKDLFSLHPHSVLAAVGTFGLLQRLNPSVFIDEVVWTDIFSDADLHMTKNVEVL